MTDAQETEWADDLAREAASMPWTMIVRAKCAECGERRATVRSRRNDGTRDLCMPCLEQAARRESPAIQHDCVDHCMPEYFCGACGIVGLLADPRAREKDEEK